MISVLRGIQRNEDNPWVLLGRKTGKPDGAKVYTDEHRGYHGLPNHKTVNHSVGKYVDGMAHTNGIESFWSMLKRGYHDTYHKMSAKHLDRYVNEFARRHNARSGDTLDQTQGLYAA